MPIRLLVAITIGIATFSLLVPLSDDVAESEATEVTVEPNPARIQPETNVTLAVVTADSEPVEDATVVVRGRSLPVEDGPLTFQTGPDSHTVSLRIARDASADVPVDFRQTQRRGTVSFDVVVPTDAYVDDRANPEVTVIHQW
jgi:hypothetical protein